MSGTHPFTPTQPHQPHHPPNLSHHPELIHTIGSFLCLDGDYQSLSRMSLACKAYKEDFAGWMNWKRGEFVGGDGKGIGEMTRGQRGVVGTSRDCGDLVISSLNGFVLYCCGTEIDKDLKALHTMRDVTLHVQDRPLPFPNSINTPFLLTLRSLSLKAHIKQQSTSSLIHGYPAFLKHLKFLCPQLISLEYDASLEVNYRWADAVKPEGFYFNNAEWIKLGREAGLRELTHGMAYELSRWSVSVTMYYEVGASTYKRKYEIGVPDSNFHGTSLRDFCAKIADLYLQSPGRLIDIDLTILAIKRTRIQMDNLFKYLLKYMHLFGSLAHKLVANASQTTVPPGCGQPKFLNFHPTACIQVQYYGQILEQGKKPVSFKEEIFNAMKVVAGSVEERPWQYRYKVEILDRIVPAKPKQSQTQMKSAVPADDVTPRESNPSMESELNLAS